MIGDILPSNGVFLDKTQTPLHTCICLFILLSKPSTSSVSLILDIIVIGDPVVSFSLVSNSPDETAWTWMDAHDLLGVELGLVLTSILCPSGRTLYENQKFMSVKISSKCLTVNVHTHQESSSQDQFRFHM